MIFIVTGENRHLFESELAQMHRQRKAVFIDDLGWKVPAIGGMEIDSYDHANTIYLLLHVRPARSCSRPPASSPRRNRT